MTGTLLLAAGFAVLIVILVWRSNLRRRADAREAIEAWLERFSPESYLPMLRLTEPRDIGFLNTHCGPLEAARYKRLQRAMLRDYLRGLSRDFNRLHTLASHNRFRGQAENADSALALVEEKLEFIFSVWSIELRLLLDEVTPCPVNLRPLLANVTELTDRVREIARRRNEYRL
jgi:hypothetical protein